MFHNMNVFYADNNCPTTTTGFSVILFAWNARRLLKLHAAFT